MDEDNIDSFWQQYSLSADPFSNQFDNAIYAPPEWQHHQEMLQYLCHYSNLLLLIHGPKGVGKTTFSQWLISQFNRHFKTYWIAAKPDWQISTLPMLLNDGFQLAEELSQNTSAMLSSQLAIMQSRNHQYILLIDNADQLPTTTIDSLLGLIKQQFAGQATLHIILIGSNEFNQRMVQHHDQFIHAMPIEPLSAAQVKFYLEKRFTAANLAGKLPFSDKQIHKFFQLSQGIPMNLNQQVTAAMQGKPNRSQDTSTDGQARRYKAKIIGGLALAVAIVIAITVSLGMSNAKNPQKTANTQLVMATPSYSQTTTSNTATHQATAVINAARVNAEKNAGTTHSVAGNAAATHSAITRQTQQPTMIINNTQPTRTSAKRPANRIVAAQSRQPRTTTQQQRTNPARNYPSRSNPVAKQTATKATITKQLSAKQPRKTSVSIDTLNQDRNQLNASIKNMQRAQVKETQLLSRNTAQAANKPNYPTTTAAKSFSNSENQLLSLNSQNYTVQLLGSHDKTSIEKFIARNNLQQQANIYRSELRGKTWYVAVYGQYNTIHQARAAIAGLPASVKKLRPWVKSLTTVQKAIRTYG